MKYLKKIAICYLAFTIMLSLFYFIGAFGNHSFDMSRWNKDSLFFLSAFGGMFSIGSAVISFIHSE